MSPKKLKVMVFPLLCKSNKNNGCSHTFTTQYIMKCHKGLLYRTVAPISVHLMRIIYHHGHSVVSSAAADKNIIFSFLLLSLPALTLSSLSFVLMSCNMTYQMTVDRVWQVPILAFLENRKAGSQTGCSDLIGIMYEMSQSRRQGVLTLSCASFDRDQCT